MMIPDDIQAQVKEELAQVSQAVIVRIFTSKTNCQYCNDALQLMKEIAPLCPNLKLEEYDVELNEKEAKLYQVEQTPAILIHKEDAVLPIRFYGIPSGYEFSSLIESIKMVGTGYTELTDQQISVIKAIDKPVTIKVFVTPSCPYCPPAVINAFKMALINPAQINAIMFEASEFPEVSNHYGVRSVPKIVINETTSFEGTIPMDQYLDKVLKA
jgi:glutaredoxin-like protein